MASWQKQPILTKRAWPDLRRVRSLVDSVRFAEVVAAGHEGEAAVAALLLVVRQALDELTAALEAQLA